MGRPRNEVQEVRIGDQGQQEAHAAGYRSVAKTLIANDSRD
jgi:hypothetical protein